MYRTAPVILRLSTAVFALLLAALPLTVAAQSVPTDGLQLWLRAEAVDAAPTADVASWADRRGRNVALTQPEPTRRPTYVPGALNGRPLLRFEGNDGFEPAALAGAVFEGSPYTVFRVTRQGDRGYIDVAEGHLDDGQGGAALQRFVDGQVAEVLVYDRRLSKTETETVSAVLGRRYNLSPGATAARSGDAAGGTSEGIRVHGAWTITVRDADGSLDEQRTLENALKSSAGGVLAGLLARTETPGFWQVLATAPKGSNICEKSDGSAARNCGMTEASSHPLNWWFPGLTASVPSSGANADKLVLEGSFTAQRTGPISTVRTRLKGCGASTSPANCSGSTPKAITSKDLSSTVNVSKGQQVNIKVVIGFQ